MEKHRIQDFSKGTKVEVTTRSHGLIYSFYALVLANILTPYQSGNRQVKLRLTDQGHPASPQRIIVVGGGTSAREIKKTT